MNKRFEQREPSVLVHPIVDRLLLAPSGATLMRGGPLHEAPDVHRVISAHSSAYLMPIDTDNTEFLLVDTGADTRARNILRTLTRINAGLTETAVKAILVTHGHLDHVAGLGMFSDAQIYVSQEDKNYVEGSVRAEGLVGRFLGRSPKKSRPHTDITIVKDGETIDIGNCTITAHAVPGHTTGSMSYSTGDNLFAGDAMIFNKYGGVSLSPNFLSHDTTLAAQSLAWLVDTLDGRSDTIRTIIPSHSDTGSIETLKQWRRSEVR